MRPGAGPWLCGTKAFIQTRREQGEQAEKRGKEVKEKVVGSEAQGRRARGKTWRQWPVDSRAPAEGGGGEGKGKICEGD